MTTSKPHLQFYTSPPNLEDGRNFHIFPLLPPELRRMTWRNVLERPRILRIHLGTPAAGGTYRVLVDTRQLHSKLLRVNMESRQVVTEFDRARVPCRFLKDRIDGSSSASQEGYLAFNPEHDFLHLSSRSIYVANFLCDLKTVYDPHHVGLRNLAIQENMLILLLHSLSLPDQVDPEVRETRETIGNIFSQLHQVFFVTMSALGRQVHRHSHGLMCDRDIFNRSYPVMAQTGAFERLRRDPRDIAQDLNRLLISTFRPRGAVEVWNQLLDKLEISPSHISYRLLLTSIPSAPGVPYFRIYDCESANVFLEAEDEMWMEADRGTQEPDPLNDGLAQAVEPAIGFWLFPIDALDAFPLDNRPHESFMLDMTQHWPELALLSL